MVNYRPTLQSYILLSATCMWIVVIGEVSQHAEIILGGDARHD